MASIGSWFNLGADLNRAKKAGSAVGNAVATGVGDVGSFVNNDILHPAEHAAGNVVNALSAHNTIAPVARAVGNIPQDINNDVIRPIDRSVIRPTFSNINRNFAQPTEQAFGNLASYGSRSFDQVNPFDNGLTFKQRTPTTNFSIPQQLNQNLMPGASSFTDFASQIPDATRTVLSSPARIPLGNGVTTGSFVRQIPQANATVFAGPARSVLGTAQGLSGLYDMATQGTLTPQQSGLDKFLNTEAGNVDQFAKNQNINPLLYHGSQLATDIATFAIPGAGAGKALAKVGEYAPKLAKGIGVAGDVLNSGEKLASKATKVLDKGNLGERIAGKSIKNIASPKYQAVNAGFTGLQAGKSASSGHPMSKGQLAQSLAIGSLGFPVAGAVGSETLGRVARPVVNKLGRTTTNDVKRASIAKEKALRGARAKRQQAIREQDQQSHINIDALNEHLQGLRKHDEQLNAQGLSENSAPRKTNLKAQKMTIEARNAEIKKLSSSGYLGLGNSVSRTPDEYRNEIKKLLDSEMKNYRENQQKYRASDTTRNAPDMPGSKNSSTATAEKLFKEYEKNPDKFIDKYGLMPPNLRHPVATADRATKPLSVASSRSKKSGVSTKPVSNVKTSVLSSKNSVAPEVQPSAMSKAAGDINNQLASIDEKALRNTKARATNLPKPTPSNKIGKALGLSDKQMREANATEKATLATRLESPRNRPQQPALKRNQGRINTKPSGSLSSEKTPTPQSRLQPTQKNGVKSLSGKYTTNATKVNVAKVNPGDYQKVRSNAQLVQSVVNNHAQGVIHALRRVPKEERQSFWHKVEDPSLPRSSAMKEAISRWQGLADTVHATSHALGGDTPHLANYARHNWDLSNPEQAALYEKLMSERVKTTNYNPEDFRGLDNKPRAFDTIKQGEALGFKLKNSDPIDDVAEYAQKSKSQLKTQAVAKGMDEAESDIPARSKSETQAIGYKKSIETTKKGVKELQSLYPSARSTNKGLTTYRAINHGAKQFLLSVSQFHPININMQAAPALAFKGHPIRAMRGLIDTAASLNRKYSDNIMQNALHDGTLENAARIGSPVATGSDFTAGKLDSLDSVTGKLKTVKKLGNIGERAIFERQLPAMHVQMIRGVVADLKKKGISLDSIEARKAGNTINEIMGYVNTELRNLSPTVQRGLGDLALAPQFTRSKWQILGQAFNPKAYAGSGLAGKYAASAVFGKYAAEAAITLAVGAILGQKSDDWKDVLVRTLVHPSIPTPFKDKKGNTIELGLPHNYISEAGNLVGSLERGKNGRLGIAIKPNDIGGNLRDYGKGRLAILPGDALKVATNTDFADKPLYNPTSSVKDQIAQGATTLLSGHLPIGLQGIAYTSGVKNHLPQNIEQVLNGASPGSNPVLKSIASSFGLTARTDKTVGKGLSTTRYYNALDSAKHGLDRQASDAIDIYTGGKKNPVTGQYEIKPNVNDSRAKSTVLLQNPTALDHLIKMNTSLSKEGEKVDPLWLQSKDKITKYLQYQAMPPASADKTDWNNKNKWYSAVAKQRNTFFNSLPPGDPNKPKNPFQYPNPDPQTKKDMDTYYGLANSTAKGNFIDNHPDLAKQWNAVSNYNNEIRAAQGYAPLKNYPTPSNDTQKFMDTYSAASKADRKAIRNANPSAYQKMIGFYDQLDLYNINKQGALGQLQGEPDYTNKSAKAIKSIGEDFYIDQNGNYHLIPAGWMLGMGGSGSGTSSSTNNSARAQLKFNMARKTPKIVGAIAPPTKMATPSFTSGLQSVYHQKALSKAPTVTFKKSRFGVV